MGFDWGSFAGSLVNTVSGLFQNRSNRRAQEEFARQGVRWRVEDARAAGVHPLFALGASTSGFAPSPVIPFDAVERGVQGARERNLDTSEKELRVAQIGAMKAQAGKDSSEAAYFDSLAARERQSAGPGFPELATDQDGYKKFGDPMQVHNQYSNAIVRRLNPEMHDLGFEPFGHALDPRGGIDNAASQPLWSRFETGDGAIALPYTPANQGVMEALEGLDIKYLPAVIAENRRRFGDAGVARLLKLYDPGKLNYGSWDGEFGRSDAEQRRSREGYGYRGKGAPSRR